MLFSKSGTQSRQRPRRGKKSTGYICSFRISTTRKGTYGARSPRANLTSKVDSQNLAAEKANVHSFSHKYQQLPLIPVEDFLEVHPEHTEDDEKTMMFARINHELSERELLEQERQGLLKKKQGLIADNKKRKDDLASLDKDLETFIDVCDSQIEATSCERVMLTRTRPPNLYKRSSRSNIELFQTLFRNKTFRSRSI